MKRRIRRKSKKKEWGRRRPGREFIKKKLEIVERKVRISKDKTLNQTQDNEKKKRKKELNGDVFRRKEK